MRKVFGYYEILIQKYLYNLQLQLNLAIDLAEELKI